MFSNETLKITKEEFLLHCHLNHISLCVHDYPSHSGDDIKFLIDSGLIDPASLPKICMYKVKSLDPIKLFDGNALYNYKIEIFTQPTFISNVSYCSSNGYLVHRDLATAIKIIRKDNGFVICDSMGIEIK